MFQKRSLLVLLVLFCVLAAGCERTTINEVLADPSHYRDKDVNVAGTVTTSIGALGRGIYQIDDGTGKIWIWSESRGVPSKGAVVGVRGRVVPTITFLGINYATVMRETGRKSAS
jgi:hypothetical protein